MANTKKPLNELKSKFVSFAITEKEFKKFKKKCKKADVTVSGCIRYLISDFVEND